MIRVKLHSIPPANRRPSSLSSMRAATKTGMVFVGSAQKKVEPETFKANIVEPNTARIKTLQEYRAAIHSKMQWLEEQALGAATPEEQTWWNAELDRVSKR